MKKIICFGDLLLSLTPEGCFKFIQSNSLNFFFTGAESNVAASLAQFGMDVELVTRIPDNFIGESARASLRKFGIGTNNVQSGGDRIGIVYTERGAAQRPSTVVYDRANSSFSTSPIDSFDWVVIFKNADWFHFTGITPALSNNLATITLEAIQQAKKNGLFVSCDMNYRNKLWSKEKAGRVMRTLLPYVDLLVANEWDAKYLLGIDEIDSKGHSDAKEDSDYAKALNDTFGIKYVACTKRNCISASVNDWSATLWHEGIRYYSRSYSIDVVNRVGTGDAFTAGLIYGLKSNMNLKTALEFATSASCLKHSIELDYNLVSLNQVIALSNGNSSGNIQR